MQHHLKFGEDSMRSNMSRVARAREGMWKQEVEAFFEFTCFKSRNELEILKSQVTWPHLSDTCMLTFGVAPSGVAEKDTCRVRPSVNFGFIYQRNGFCDEVEKHHNFSHFAMVIKFPLAGNKRHNPDRKPTEVQHSKECSLHIRTQNYK